MLNKFKTNVVLQIDLELLKDDPNNFFETEGGTDIEEKNAEMKDSIEDDGLLNPVIVRPDPEEDGKFLIVSGHRRKLIYTRLAEEGKEKYKKMPCIIKNIKDELKAHMMLLEANTTARDVSDWEKSQAVKAYGEILEDMKKQGVEMSGRRRDNIAKALHISKTQVGQYEHINKNLGDEYKQELKDGNIGVSVADRLASLPPEKQAEIHEEKGADVKLSDVQRDILEPPPTEKVQQRHEYIVVKKKFGIDIEVTGVQKEENGVRAYEVFGRWTAADGGGDSSLGTFGDYYVGRVAVMHWAAKQDRRAALALVEAGYLSEEDIPKEFREKEQTEQTEQTTKKRTGEIYERTREKMEKEGFDALDPCEQCVVASCCESCCKTCKEPCSGKQECRADKINDAPMKIYAIKKNIEKLERFAKMEKEMSATEENQGEADKYEAVAKYADELIEKAKQDLFDLSGINMF